MTDPVIDAIDMIEKIEIKAAALYDMWSGRFVDDEEASFFFFQLHLDEMMHAQLAAACKRMILRDRKSFIRRFRGPVDGGIIDAIDSAARDVSTIEEALEATETLEITISENYIRNVLTGLKLKPFLHGAFEALTSMDHVERVREFLETIRLRNKARLSFKKSKR